MPITYLPPTYNLITYLRTNPPTHLLRCTTYLPTYPPTYLPTYYLPTYLSTHSPTYLHATYLPTY
jgi:hypothetical protein